MKPFIAVVLCCGMAFAQTVTISENGNSNHVIVIPDNPPTVLKTAAKEQFLLRRSDRPAQSNRMEH